MRHLFVKKAGIVLLILICLTAMSSIALAAMGSKENSAGESVNNDWITLSAENKVINKGKVLGDMITASQEVRQEGSVNGDLLGVAATLDVTGNTQGNIRFLAADSTVDGLVERNLNLFSGSIRLLPNTSVGGSSKLSGGSVDIEGKYTKEVVVYSSQVTVNGTFSANLSIYSGEEASGSKATSSIVIKKGTKVDGILTIQSAREPVIEQGAAIGAYEWRPIIKNERVAGSYNVASLAWRLLRNILTGLVFFLMGAVLWRLFPKSFRKQKENIASRPAVMMGIGIIVLLSTLASVLIMVLLNVFAVTFMSWQVGVVISTLLLLLYAIILIPSVIPVSYWLGDVILAKKGSVLLRFGTGVLCIVSVLFLFSELSNLEQGGFVFSVMYWLSLILIVAVGSGNMVMMISDWIAALRENENMEKN